MPLTFRYEFLLLHKMRHVQRANLHLLGSARVSRVSLKERKTYQIDKVRESRTAERELEYLNVEISGSILLVSRNGDTQDTYC